jgi:hypothetical protein
LLGVDLPPQCEISRTITPSTIGGYFRSMAPRSMEVSKVLFISRDVDTIALVHFVLLRDDAAPSEYLCPAGRDWTQAREPKRLDEPTRH